jgi:hypothetical protein
VHMHPGSDLVFRYLVIYIITKVPVALVHKRVHRVFVYMLLDTKHIRIHL